MPDTTPANLHTLSLQEFARTLQERGVPLSYSQLSKFVNQGDIAELLQITGGKNGRKVPYDAVETLVAFWPRYEEARGELPQAPLMLRAFLHKGDVAEGALVRSREPAGEIARTDEPRRAVDAPDRGLTLQAAVLQGAASRLPMYLTAGEAARVWRTTQKKFRKMGPKPAMRVGDTERDDRWLLSDLLPKAGEK